MDDGCGRWSRRGRGAGAALRVGEQWVLHGHGLCRIVDITSDGDGTWVQVETPNRGRPTRFPMQDVATALRAPLARPAAHAAWSALLEPGGPVDRRPQPERYGAYLGTLIKGGVEDQIRTLRSLYASPRPSAGVLRFISTFEDVLLPELARALERPLAELRAEARHGRPAFPDPH